LAQLGSRPVVVAYGLGGWIATLALARDAANLAAALVLVDMPVEPRASTVAWIANQLRLRHEQAEPVWDEGALDDRDCNAIHAALVAAAPALMLPTLVVRGLGTLRPGPDDAAFDGALPNAEVVDVSVDIAAAPNRGEAFLGRLLDFLERRQPRGPSEFREGSDPRTLRDAMGCFATGITIVTAVTADGEPIGLTANSFTSVSLDPPLLLVCIANSAGSAPVLREVERFGVNVLQTSQQPTSNRFASRGADRFAETPWEPGAGGVPLLIGSLVSFECRRHAIHEGGDHFILVGHVERAQFEPRRDPLLYFRGKYRRLHFV
ncbi:MAG TPA: flavin reductase family protein, partial [Novosphingobium sp.]